MGIGTVLGLHTIQRLSHNMPMYMRPKLDYSNPSYTGTGHFMKSLKPLMTRKNTPCCTNA